MFYEDVFRALNEAGVRYLVVGGLAVNFHGVRGVTQDIDLFGEMTPANIKKLASTLTTLGYHPRAPVRAELLADPAVRKRWMDEKKNLKAFSFYHPKRPDQEVDILLDAPMDFEKAEEACEIREADDLKIPLVSVRDLIEMKEAVARSTDLWDIKMLRKLQEAERK